VGIQSTGIGSGLDVNTLITKLMAVESQPLTTLAKKEASFQAKLSAYGSLNGAVSAFQSALSSLNNPSTFQSLNGTSSDSSIVSASASSTASAGSYSIAISKLAQAQGLSSAGQVSASTAISDGTATTLTFQFGTITGTLGTVVPNVGKYLPGATFVQDASQATGTLTIDSTNNSLQGIRDAINIANIGVTASIVGDGSAAPYHLVLNSSKTGAASSLKIAATGGDGSIAALMNYDPEAVQNFTEVSSAQNANLKINGIDITSASNTVSGAIQGVALNLGKVGTTSVSVSANTSGIQTGLNNFVKAYNDLNATIKSLAGYDASTKKGGLLLGDATTQSIQNQVRNTLSNAVNGLGGGLTTLSQIGVVFQKDGSLSFDSAKLTSALNTNFSDVGGLFASLGKASDSLVSIASSSSETKPGSYALTITQLATQGGLTGSNALAEPISIAVDTTLSVTLDGVNASVPLAAGTTYTRAQLATLIQSSINGISAFSSIGSSISASIDGSNHLVLKSSKYGSVSGITIADGTGTLASDLFGLTPIALAGTNVAGTLNGISAIGSGQTLSAPSGSDGAGLKLLIAGGSTGARGTVNFSRGYAYQLNNVLSGFLGGSGTIASTTNGVNKSIVDIGKQRVILNSRLFDTEARYRAQFTALDTVISGLNNTSSFLTQQLSALNGTKQY
jgi:flagellar hook-associated protein 2